MKEIEPGDLEEMWKLYKEEGLSIDTLSQEYAYPKKLIYKEFALKGEIFHTGQRSTLEKMDAADVEAMVGEYLDWVPLRVIMEKYNIGHLGVIYNMLTLFKIPPRTQSKDYLLAKKGLMDEAVNMYEKGFPIWQICEACSVDPAKLYKELHFRGVKIGRKRGDGGTNRPPV